MSRPKLSRRGLRRFRIITATVLGLACLLGTVGVWLLSSDARREVDALATANADSTQWSLAQAEVELLTLKNALLSAALTESPDLSAVRRRFDVFYSRMSTLALAPSFEEVRRIPAVELSIATLERFLLETIPLIDGPDADLRAALLDLVDEVQGLRTELRTISLAGVRVFAQASEAQRGRVASALTDLGGLTLLLFLILLGILGTLLLTIESGRRRAAEIALARSRLRSVVGTSLDAVLVVGRDGRILDFNGAAERIFGYTPEEAINQPMVDLIVPDHFKQAHDAGMQRHIDTGEKHVIDKGLIQLEARDRAGRVFPVELSISTADSEEGEIFVSFIRDISKRVAAETELVEARDKALAGEKAKADLLAVMSHEMRTPLNGIIGGLDLLSGTALSAEQRNLIEVMDTSGNMLLEHVNTVLEIARVDTGATVAARDAFDPDVVVREVVESLRVQARARGNALSWHVVGQAVGPSIGDAARLRQVLVNLVGNAVKFTKGGTIIVELERLPEEPMVEIRVIDSGIGIAKADVERVFDDFVTLDSSYAREVEGTGLGLGIVRRLVSVMDGEVGVESDMGEGSVFWLRLPLPPTLLSREVPVEAGSRDPAPSDTSAMSVLVVEDNEINRMVVREMLAAAGCRSTEATDGERGVKAAAAQPFDLILMDISMPRLDGIVATGQIRNGEGPNATTPIVALTAHALPADIQRFQAAGMTDVLVKPLTRDRLMAVLGDVRVDLADHAAPAPAMSELVEALGAEKALEISRRATGEIRAGHVTLLAMIESEDTLRDVEQLAHKLAGLAALVGLTEAHAHLRALEAAAGAGVVQSARSELVALTEHLSDG